VQLQQQRQTKRKHQKRAGAGLQEKQLLERQRQQLHTRRQEPMGTLVDFDRIIRPVVMQASELLRGSPEVFLQLMGDTASSCCLLITSDSDRLAESLVDAVMHATTGMETLLFSLVQHCELRLCMLSEEGNATAKLVLPSFRQQVREQVGHAYIDEWTEDSLERPRLCAFIARLFLAGWMPFAAVRSVLTERITSTSDAAAVACALQMFRVLSPSPQDPDARVRPETAPHQKELRRLFLTLLHCPAAVKLDSYNAAATRAASAAAATSATKSNAAAATDAWESSQATLLHEMRQLWGKH